MGWGGGEVSSERVQDGIRSVPSQTPHMQFPISIKMVAQLGSEDSLGWL